MTKRKSKSAADFLAELNADPEYVVRRSAQEDARVLRDAEVRSIARPLLDRLGAVGYPVATLDELATKYAPLPGPVVAVLLEWLPEGRDMAAQKQVAVL